MKFFRLLLPGFGLLLLGYLVGTLGIEEILRNFALMEGFFPFVLLLACLWHITNSIAWRFAFPPNAFRPRLSSLFMAKLAGEAVNQLTPLANVGGEPLKAYLLKQQAPTSRGFASVVVNKTAQIFTGLLFTTLGLGLVVRHWSSLPLSLPRSVQFGLGLLLSIAALLVWILYSRQKHLFSSGLALLHKLGLKTHSIERRMAKAARIDANIELFYRGYKGRFALAMFFHALGWLLGACETFVILRALDAGVEFEVAFLITALSLIINSLFFFMPSNIGVLEGGQVFLFMSLGLNPALGLSLGIVKRMRKIFWIFIGWIFLARMSRGLEEPGLLDEEPTLAAERQQGLHNRLNYR